MAMTLRKRYTLIVLGVIIFAVAAPAMVLGIRGIVYDFTNKRFVKTGILVAKFEPKNAVLTIEGNGIKRQYEGSTTRRFLFPGDYNVNISSDGFHSWEKRLTVRGGLVTWVTDGPDKVYLLPKNPELISEAPILKNEPEEKDEHKYIFKKGTSGLVLVQQNGREKVLATGIPTATDAKIFPLSNGLLLITLNRTLYQVKENLEYIAEGVDKVSWNEDIGRVIYSNSNEISFYNPYDPGANQRQVLIRTSESGGNFCIISEMGYALRVFGNTVRAIELDGRDKRNSYDIINSNSLLDIVNCDKEGEEIIIKDGLVYKTYTFR